MDQSIKFIKIQQQNATDATVDSTVLGDFAAENAVLPLSGSLSAPASTGNKNLLTVLV